MGFYKKENDLKIARKLSITAKDIWKNKKNNLKLLKEKQQFLEIRDLLSWTEPLLVNGKKTQKKRESGDSFSLCKIPIIAAEREFFHEDGILSYFNEKTLFLKEFLKENGGCSLGTDVEVPNEGCFKTLIACHAAEILLLDDKNCHLIRLYVLYSLSVHAVRGVASACVGFLNYGRFKINGFEILLIFINFGCTLESLIDSNNVFKLPVKSNCQFEKGKGENRLPDYFNADRVADLILFYANLNLIKNDELKLLLKALTRLMFDRKITHSRQLSSYYMFIIVLCNQLTQVYYLDHIASRVHLKNKHLLHQLEVAQIVYMPLSSNLHKLLFYKIIAYLLNLDVSAAGDIFQVKYVGSVLKMLTEINLLPLHAFCILQFLNASLPNITATDIKASDVNNLLFCMEKGFFDVKDSVDLIRLKLEVVKLRSLVVNGVEKGFPGKGTNVKRKMVDFLKDLSFLILPSGMGSKRLDFFAEQVRKYSGELRDKSVATHVIIDESVGENREKCLMALKTYGIVLSDGVKYVGTKWLSKCFAMKTLIDTKYFEFGWIEKEIERLRSKLDPDRNKNSDYKEFVEHFDESPKKKTKIEFEKCICSQSSAPNRDVSGKKKLIIDELQKLADAFAARNDTWRAHSYRNAVSAVARYNKDITSFPEACTIPGIGERMALKIMEILESGKCGKVQDILDEKTKVLELFCNIWGVGPSTAENWYHMGLRTLEDLKEKAKLNKQQEIGLKFYEDFMKRMNREDVERISSIVENELKNINCRCTLELVGSYRRGKTTCGDVDIMIVNPGPKYPLEILVELTDKLRRKGYLTHDLVELDYSSSPDENNHRKYMGVFKIPGDEEIHRRIDIFVVPENEYAPGLMHYTGSALFNRSIRLFASRKGLTLNEHGLYSGIIRKGSEILNEGELVPTPSEKDIFNYLGLEYKLPEERDH